GEDRSVDRRIGGAAVAEIVDTAALVRDVSAEGRGEHGESTVAVEDAAAQTLAGGAISTASSAVGGVRAECAVGDDHRSAMVEHRAAHPPASASAPTGRGDFAAAGAISTIACAESARRAGACRLSGLAAPTSTSASSKSA